MLTVNHALEQGREVYAIPAGLDEHCAKGTNRLIHDQKAKLVENAEDILEDFYSWFPDKLSGGCTLPPEKAQARLSEHQDKPPKKPAPPPAAAPQREVLSRAQQESRFTDDQLGILAAVVKDALTADEIVEQTQIPMKRALSAITMLQLDGAVEERPGRRFYALVELEGQHGSIDS